MTRIQMLEVIAALGVAVVALVAALSRSRMASVTARVVGGLALMGLIGCCAFGFLASFEPPGFIVWRLIYAAMGLGLTGLFALNLRSLLRRPQRMASH